MPIRDRTSRKGGNGGSHTIETRRTSQPRSAPAGRDWMEPFSYGWPSFARNPFSLLEGSGWRQPAIDIRDAGETYEVTAELPGVTKDDVELSVAGDRLEIRAEQTEEHEEDEGGYYQREIGRRSFYRSVPLPQDADPEEVEAELEDGCLCVSIGKREGEAGGRRRINIK